jgi:putative two-component system response regulator
MALRVAMYLIVAAIVGVLFDRLRHAMRTVQASAARVALREREGMLALARGAEAKDSDTGDHVVRVQVLSERLALEAGLGARLAAGVGFAGLLHDVGKLHVADRILLKPGPLTDEEWATMRMHTIWGADILDAGDAYALARRIARWHHENIDGTGYPDGLRGAAIPLEARIVRIADAFDAMTHDRPYQVARSVERALEELRRGAGRQFDPGLVDLLVGLLDAEPRLRWAIARSGRPDRRPRPAHPGHGGPHA